ncbi:MAG: VOC family protein [Dehalococcoidales bacterium]|nr:VOC family protein [Dehalococcoidales bacterium]
MKLTPNHTSFTVGDMDRSIAFYRDLLGMELISDRVAGPEFAAKVTGIPGAALRVVYLEAIGYKLELIQYTAGQGERIDPKTNRPGSAHLCFNVEDIRRAYADLKAKGVRIQGEPMVVGGGPNKDGLTIYMLDPDGITIELIQPPATANQ